MEDFDEMLKLVDCMEIVGHFQPMVLDKGDIIMEKLMEDGTSTIKVKNPGLLKVPADKEFWQMPVSHYVALAHEIGRAAVMRGLMNLERWNSVRAPEVSAKARTLIDTLKKNSEWQGISPKSAESAQLAERIVSRMNKQKSEVVDLPPTLMSEMFAQKAHALAITLYHAQNQLKELYNETRQVRESGRSAGSADFAFLRTSLKKCLGDMAPSISVMEWIVIAREERLI